MTTLSEDSTGLFVEQAEYLDSGEFVAWTADHPNESEILQKLCRGGAKLITGPRGCGKTTLLLKAYRKLLAPAASGLPVYVNFKSSLRLEPLYKSQANALYWFNQWMILKCYVGLLQTLEALDIDWVNDLKLTKKEAAKAAEQLELGVENGSVKQSSEISLESLVEDINRVLSETGRVRCLLFFDDAAHAFSPDQQRDFFDFYRRIKSNKIAPKAAIYPGVTIISPSFHIGHDAEEIDVWLDPYLPAYLPFMRGLLSRRLPEKIFLEMNKTPHLLDLLCFGAFGMPRALLNIVREFYSEESSGDIPSLTKKFNSRSVRTAIGTSYESTVGIYSSLRHKLPLYEKFIKAGDELLEAMLLSIKTYNQGKPQDRQSVSVAVQTPLSQELARVFGFLEYAGLVMSVKKVSRGVKGRFEIFQLHSGGLIDRNVLLGQKSPRADSVAFALEKRNAHEFTRINPANLLNVAELSEKLGLSLPPCQNCETPRASETAKFCLECGAPLTALSTFKSLVRRDISELPLSKVRVDRIKANSSIKNVGDILLDHEHRELRGVPWIGPYWAEQIYRYAEEFIA